jgi:hypothetical protein
MKRYRWRSILTVLIVTWGVATCAGCVTKLKIGPAKWAVGLDAQCDSLDGCVVGVEAGGWRAGVALFPDIGPLEDEDAYDPPTSASD